MTSRRLKQVDQYGSPQQGVLNLMAILLAFNTVVSSVEISTLGSLSEVLRALCELP